jgi:hypothetical protein
MTGSLHRIHRWWQDHFKLLLALALVTWVVVITLLHYTINAPRHASALPRGGAVATVLPVGGLPVT